MPKLNWPNHWTPYFNWPMHKTLTRTPWPTRKNPNAGVGIPSHSKPKPISAWLNQRTHNPTPLGLAMGTLPLSPKGLAGETLTLTPSGLSSPIA